MFIDLLRRFSFAAAAAVLTCACLPHPAKAQAIEKPAGFPNKPIRLIIPFGAGTPPDILGRLIAPALSERVGVSVIVDNKPGANGNIGAGFTSSTPPDGYNLVICGLTCATADVFYKTPGFETRRDLAPVINIGAFPSVLIVGANSPYKTAPELFDYIRKHPGEVTYASYGRGGSPHLAAEQLQTIGKLDMVHIPFGTSDPVLDVSSGRVTFMFIPAASAVARKGLVHSLAVASAAREPMLPELPTVAEFGFKGFNMEAWNGLYASKNTPPDRLEYLNRQMQAVLDDTRVKAQLYAAGLRVIGGTRAELATYYDQDNKRWHQVADSAGIKPE
jgi:tripartite-type tricarboxylate transporter receptor subunit TctC